MRGFLVSLLVFLSSTSATQVGGAISAPCFVCSLIVNELEGFLLENVTTTEITNIISNEICVLFRSPKLRNACHVFGLELPQLLADEFKHWNVSTICQRYRFCKEPISEPSDPQPIPTFQIDLNDPPSKRWTKICSIPTYRDAWRTFVDDLYNTLGPKVKYIAETGDLVNQRMPMEYAQEIEGCAAAIWPNQSERWGWLTILNIGK